LPVWKQSGAKNISYEPASPECTTNLKSNVSIIGPNGKSINPSTIEQSDEGIVPTWSNIPDGCKIIWEAQTESGLGSSTAVSDLWEKEDEKLSGKPDRVAMEIMALDLAYVTAVTDEVFNTLTPEEEELFLTDIPKITEIVTEKVMANMNDSLVMKSIYSTIVETNEEGYYKGEIPIPPQWPKGAYTILIKYGYNRQSEGTGGESWFFGLNKKAYTFWVEDWGPTIVGFAVGMFVPGGWIIAGTLFTVEMIADIAIANAKMARDAMGLVGLNKYHCAFPADGGYVHSYGIGYDTEEAEEEAKGEVSPENQELGEAIEQQLKTQGFANTLAVGSVMGAVVISVLAAIKSRRGN